MDMTCNANEENDKRIKVFVPNLMQRGHFEEQTDIKEMLRKCETDRTG
jgi:hypothetical protein